MTALSEKTPYVKPVSEIVTFRFLSDSEIVDLFASSDLFETDEGEMLIEEGQVSPYLFGIIDGSVSVSVLENEGKQVYVTSLGPGDVFGEAGMFMRVKRTATVTALGKVTVIRIHRNALARFLKLHPQAGNKILLTIIFSLLRKLRHANQELAYERKDDIGQDDIDSIVNNLMDEQTD
jgi:CRP/FNR family transcriptional regulator, cyclic AMP receptor protein